MSPKQTFPSGNVTINSFSPWLPRPGVNPAKQTAPPVMLPSLVWLQLEVEAASMFSGSSGSSCPLMVLISALNTPSPSQWIIQITSPQWLGGRGENVPLFYWRKWGWSRTCLLLTRCEMWLFVAVCDCVWSCDGREQDCIPQNSEADASPDLRNEIRSLYRAHNNAGSSFTTEQWLRATVVNISGSVVARVVSSVYLLEASLVTSSSHVRHCRWSFPSVLYSIS